MSQKLEIKILLNEKKTEIVFTNVSEHCAAFGTKKKLATFGERVGGLHDTF